jgi:hypothetical protein
MAFGEASSKFPVDHSEVKIADLTSKATHCSQYGPLLVLAPPSFSRTMETHDEPPLNDSRILVTLWTASVFFLFEFLSRCPNCCGYIGELVRIRGESVPNFPFLLSRSPTHSHPRIVGIDRLEVLQFQVDGVHISESLGIIPIVMEGE